MFVSPGQARVLSAARNLVRRHGYAAVSLRRIAAEARYSPAGLYAHYAGLADILDALADTVRRELAARLEAAADTSGDARARLVAVGHAYIDFAAARPAEFEILFRYTRSPRKTGRQTSFDLLRRLARAIAPKAETAEIDAVCLRFWAAAHGLADLRTTHLADAGVDWAAVAEATLHHQLKGLK